MKSFDERGVMETEDWHGDPGPVPKRVEQVEVPERYELLHELGRGGFAVVYAARDRQLDRKVALKVLQHRHSAEHEQRLVREAQVLAKLRHPAVVTVYDVTSHAGRVVIAMELVEGNTLRAWAKDKSLEDKLAACVAAGRGLAAVHEAQLVHRDFKPDNVLVDHKGDVRVADFGLARIARSTDDDPPAVWPHGTEPLRTTTGALVGTLPYMAPELLTAKPANARSDQFAFAVSVVEVLASKRPFRGSTLDEYEKAVFEPPIIPDAIPGWVRTVLTRALSPDPKQRFESMTELLELLDRKRRPTALLAGGAALVLGGALITFAVTRGTNESPALSPISDCQTPALDAAWSPARSSAVRNAFDAAKISPAQRDTALTTLDSYRNKLADAHATACRARATEGADLAALRATCLERRTVELAAIGERLEHVDAALAPRALSAINNLSLIDDCESVAHLGGRVPRKPNVAEEGARIDTELARLKVGLDFGADKDVQPQLQTLLARALKLDHPPTDGEVQMQLGRAFEGLDNIRDAEKAYHAAVVRAQEGRDDGLLVRAAFSLGLNLAKKQNKPNEGRPWVDLSIATLARLPPSPDLESKAKFALAIIELGSQPPHLDEADQAGTRAYELCVQVHGEGANSCGQMLNTLGGVALERRDLALASQRYERARAIAEAAYGVDNIAVFAPMSNQAAVAYARGEFARAVEIRKELIARATRTMGTKHYNVANVTLLLGLCLERAGKLDEAIEATKLGLAGVEAARGPDFERTREAKVQLARLQVAAGNHDAIRDITKVPLSPPLQVELAEIQFEIARSKHDLAAAKRAADTGLIKATQLGLKFEPAERLAVSYAKLLRDVKDPGAADAAKQAVERAEAVFAPDSAPAREARALH